MSLTEEKQTNMRLYFFSPSLSLSCPLCSLASFVDVVVFSLRIHQRLQ